MQSQHPSYKVGIKHLALREGGNQSYEFHKTFMLWLHSETSTTIFGEYVAGIKFKRRQCEDHEWAIPHEDSFDDALIYWEWNPNGILSRVPTLFLRKLMTADTMKRFTIKDMKAFFTISLNFEQSRLNSIFKNSYHKTNTKQSTSKRKKSNLHESSKTSTKHKNKKKKTSEFILEDAGQDEADTGNVDHHRLVPMSTLLEEEEKEMATRDEPSTTHEDVEKSTDHTETANDTVINIFESQGADGMIVSYNNDEGDDGMYTDEDSDDDTHITGLASVDPSSCTCNRHISNTKGDDIYKIANAADVISGIHRNTCEVWVSNCVQHETGMVVERYTEYTCCVPDISNYLCGTCRLVAQFGIMRFTKEQQRQTISMKDLIQRFEEYYRVQDDDMLHLKKQRLVPALKIPYQIIKIGSMIRNTCFFYIFGTHLCRKFYKSVRSDSQNERGRSDHSLVYTARTIDDITKFGRDVYFRDDISPRDWGPEYYIHGETPKAFNVAFQATTSYMSFPWSTLNSVSISLLNTGTTMEYTKFLDMEYVKFAYALCELTQRYQRHPNCRMQHRRLLHQPMHHKVFWASGISIFVRDPFLVAGYTHWAPCMSVQKWEFDLFCEVVSTHHVQVHDVNSAKNSLAYHGRHSLTYFLLQQKSLDAIESMDDDTTLSMTPIDGRACLLRSLMIRRNIKITIYPTVPRNNVAPEAVNTSPPELVAVQESFLDNLRGRAPDSKVFQKIGIPGGTARAKKYKETCHENTRHVHIRNAHGISHVTLYMIWRLIKRNEQKDCDIYTDSFDDGELLKRERLKKNVMEQREHTVKCNGVMLRRMNEYRPDHPKLKLSTVISDDDLYNTIIESKSGYRYKPTKVLHFHLYGSIHEARKHHYLRWVLGPTPRQVHMGDGFTQLVSDELVEVNTEEHEQLMDYAKYKVARSIIEEDMEFISTRLKRKDNDTVKIIKSLSKKLAATPTNVL